MGTHDDKNVVPGKPAKRKPVKKVSASAMESPQLTLFQQFLCNTEGERNQLSNTIALWDSIPRYSVSRKEMVRLRSPQHTLKLLKLDFHYQQKRLTAVIRPARIEVKDKETGEVSEMDFYPSASEELVEDALRKIAATQNQGYFDKSENSSGAIFTLHMLREELKRRGHTRSFSEITQSLFILATSTIQISGQELDSSGFEVSPYLPHVTAVSRKDWQSDPEAKWYVAFHPLVTRSIDQLTYRQFNYHQMMSHTTQLSRWIHKQLALKFTFAAHGRTFEMRFSTIKRDSGLLNAYKESRKAYAALDDAFRELQERKVLMYFEKHEIRGARSKLEDAIYTLTPSVDFIGEMKAANKRLLLASKQTPELPSS